MLRVPDYSSRVPVHCGDESRPEPKFSGSSTFRVGRAAIPRRGPVLYGFLFSVLDPAEGPANRDDGRVPAPPRRAAVWSRPSRGPVDCRRLRNESTDRHSCRDCTKSWCFSGFSSRGADMDHEADRRERPSARTRSGRGLHASRQRLEAVGSRRRPSATPNREEEPVLIVSHRVEFAHTICRRASFLRKIAAASRSSGECRHPAEPDRRENPFADGAKRRKPASWRARPRVCCIHEYTRCLGRREADLWHKTESPGRAAEQLADRLRCGRERRPIRPRLADAVLASSSQRKLRAGFRRRGSRSPPRIAAQKARNEEARSGAREP